MVVTGWRMNSRENIVTIRRWSRRVMIKVLNQEVVVGIEQKDVFWETFRRSDWNY